MSDTNRFPRTLRIGILVFDGFEPLDVWGFVEAFSISRFIGTNYASPPPYPFEVVLISNQSKPPGAGKKATPAPVKSTNGPSVAPDYFRDEALEQKIDALMIPGGIGTRILLSDKHPKDRKALIDWVRAMDQRVELMTSVCTGAAILAFAGLLDGRPAATNHAAFAWVSSQGPRVLWDNVSRWVDAGRYVTSAGVSAGTDMAFYLVERLAGRAVAEVAAKGAEYDWHRDPEEPIFYPQQAAVPGTTE
ncbi:MAG: DJ-1/PfpI family protein [Thermoanaerobaculia bacterium]